MLQRPRGAEMEGMGRKCGFQCAAICISRAFIGAGAGVSSVSPVATTSDAEVTLDAAWVNLRRSSLPANIPCLSQTGLSMDAMNYNEGGWEVKKQTQ